MATLSPVPAYVLGTARVGRGIQTLIAPRQEYGHFGLPLETPSPTPDLADKKTILGPETGSASPLMYLKGVREITYGLALVALQYSNNEGAVTTFASILSLASLGDGVVVWLNGGDGLRYKAWGHLTIFIGFGMWSVWRHARRT